MLDASGVLTALDPREAYHQAAYAALEGGSAPRILSPFVLAELDYLIGRNLGQAAERVFLEDVRLGSYEIARFTTADVGLALEVIAHYDDLRIGLADASIVVLAARYETVDLLTLDRRHFRALRTVTGQHFRLLPDDA